MLDKRLSYAFDMNYCRNEESMLSSIPHFIASLAVLVLPLTQYRHMGTQVLSVLPTEKPSN